MSFCLIAILSAGFPEYVFIDLTHHICCSRLPPLLLFFKFRCVDIY